MKYKLAIIYGILSWIVISLLSLILTPYITNNPEIPYLTMVIPILIVIVTSFFTIFYIRNFNSNEVLEGIKLGIIFIIIDIIGDYIFMLFNNISLIGDYPTHIIATIFLVMVITTFIGYLAQMTIELR